MGGAEKIHLLQHTIPWQSDANTKINVGVAHTSNR